MEGRTLPVELEPGRVTATRWIGLRKVLDGFQSGATAHSSATVDGVSGILKRLVRGVAYIPDPRGGWIPFAVREGSRLIRDSRPDVLIASSGPASSLIVAAVLGRRFGIPWVADLRDLWVDNHDYPLPEWRRPWDRALEGRVLRSAAGLVTVSEPLASRLTRFGRPVEIVLNGYDDEDYPRVTVAQPSNTSEVLRIVYTGTIYRQQSPAPLFEAVRALKESSRRIRIAFFGSPPDAIMPAAAQSGVTELIEIHPAVPRAVALKEQQSADVLLHLLWNDTSQPGVYGAKIFEYLRAGRPVLAVGSTANVSARLVIERRAGIATDQVPRITAQLEEWLRMKDSGNGIPNIPEEAKAGFSRREQTRVLERFLNSVVPTATD